MSYSEESMHKAILRKDEVIDDLSQQIEQLKYCGSALREELASNKTDYDEYNRPELDRLVKNWDNLIGKIS